MGRGRAIRGPTQHSEPESASWKSPSLPLGKRKIPLPGPVVFFWLGEGASLFAQHLGFSAPDLAMACLKEQVASGYRLPFGVRKLRTRGVGLGQPSKQEGDSVGHCCPSRQRWPAPQSTSSSSERGSECWSQAPQHTPPLSPRSPSLSYPTFPLTTPPSPRPRWSLVETGSEGSWTKRDSVGQARWFRTGPRKQMTLVEERVVGVWG